MYRGAVASQQSMYLSMIERGVRSDIVAVLKKFQSKISISSTMKLGEVKDFGTLVTASQREGKPIDSVSAGTALQRSTARSIFQNIAKKIIERAR
jgi:4-aminobutyrate aminotransferase-like enzyme